MLSPSLLKSKNNFTRGFAEIFFLVKKYVESKRPGQLQVACL